ncbi:GNAT family N-acetyltransferase [Candidatus Nomurabacteria bacterium]|nr:GNAT family N-acetyltransferase [Candidatus Nomurabacteria bacterium]
MNEDPFQNKKPGQEQLEVRVEVAKPEDLEAYKNIRIESVTLNPEAFGLTLERALSKTDDDWRAELSGDKKFFVLAVSGTDVKNAKSIAGAFKGLEEGVWRVIAVYTKPEFRKRGISERVLSKVLEEISKRGGLKAVLTVTDRPEQEAARALYKKLGFKEGVPSENDVTPAFRLFLEKNLDNQRDAG